eukprot:XP_011451916.1 PREDICTED: uncharacterized protein LOC105345483 [Crassostrea gigas]
MILVLKPCILVYYTVWISINLVVDVDDSSATSIGKEMYYCLLVLFLITWRVGAQTCRSPSDCPYTAKCCRNSRGDTLPPQEGLFPSFETTGECSSQLAYENEECDPNFCKCAPGLECYRRVSGACCPIHRCYNAIWVKQQREIWRNCFKDPNCHLPP